MRTTRLLPLLLTALLGACASTQEQTPVDQGASPQGSQAPAATPTTSAPSARGVARPDPATAPRTPGSTAASAAKSAPGPHSIYFDYDRDEIKPQFQGVIANDAKYLRENPAARVRIEGNADERGSREYNLALGQRRAETVMKALGLLGVPADRMEAVSYGEEKPRLTGHDEAAWAENRRDDVVIQTGK